MRICIWCPLNECAKFSPNIFSIKIRKFYNTREKTCFDRLFAILLKPKTCLCINWIPNIMVLQSCYLRWHLGIKTVSCRLLLWMARTNMDLKLENIGPSFPTCSAPKKILWLVFPDDICLISSSFTYFFEWVKVLSNDCTVALNWPKTTKIVKFRK